MNNPWTDFLAARLRLVHAWSKAGKSPEEICAELNHHDVMQIRGLLLTDPAKGSAPSVFTDFEAAKQRIGQLEDEAVWTDQRLSEARSEADGLASRVSQVLAILSPRARDDSSTDE